MAVQKVRGINKLAFSFAACVLLVGAPVMAQSAIGTLQIDQPVEVTPAASGSAVSVDNSGYSLVSGDVVSTRRGSAAVALGNGAGMGLGPNSSAKVTKDDAGSFQVTLKAGSFMYSLPADSALTVNAGSFTVSTQGFQALAVSNTEHSYGVIQRLDDGQLRVAVRDGAAVVSSGSGNAYPLSAGQQRGFRLSSDNELLVQDAEVIQVLVDIQSPEQVRVSEEFNIRWSIGDEVRDGDFVTIAPVGAPEDEFEAVASTSVGQTIEFEAPGSPGDYEIRYIDGETGEIRSFVYLEVIRDRVVAYWWRDPRWIGGLAAVTGGAIYLATRDDSDDDDPTPVSP